MFCLELDNMVMNVNIDLLSKVCIQTFSSREMLCIYHKYELFFVLDNITS